MMISNRFINQNKLKKKQKTKKHNSQILEYCIAAQNKLDEKFQTCEYICKGAGHDQKSAGRSAHSQERPLAQDHMSREQTECASTRARAKG